MFTPRLCACHVGWGRVPLPPCARGVEWCPHGAGRGAFPRSVIKRRCGPPPACRPGVQSGGRSRPVRDTGPGTARRPRRTDQAPRPGLPSRRTDAALRSRLRGWSPCVLVGDRRSGTSFLSLGPPNDVIELLSRSCYVQFRVRRWARSAASSISLRSAALTSAHENVVALCSIDH